MMSVWKKISSTKIFSHPRLTLAEDIVELPDGTNVPYLTFVDYADSATIICTRRDEILLQKEYSYPPDEILYQFPGGKIEAGEDITAGALRELAEEAGLKPKQIVNLGWVYVDNRRSAAKMHVFLATELEEAESTGGDLEEEITSHWTKIQDIPSMIASGELPNYSVLAAWSLYQAYERGAEAQ